MIDSVKATNPIPDIEQLTLAQVSMRDGIEIEVGTDLPEDAPLMSGRFLQSRFGDGLSLHGGDVIEEQSFDVRSSIAPGLSCIFFLEGHVETRIGDRTFSFHPASGKPIHAVTVMNTDVEAFRRHSPNRQRARHLVINATPEWLARHGQDGHCDDRGSQRLFTRNLSEHRWIVPQQMLGLIRHLVAAPDPLDPIQRLRAEAQTLQILAEAISHATRDKQPDGPSLTTSRHAAAFRRARDFIMARPDAELTVRDIARVAAVSASGLQQLFRQHEGCGVFEFVRRTRLDAAHAGLLSGELTIDAASRLAGYAHPANFATAFKRRFAIAPSRIGSGRSGSDG